MTSLQHVASGYVLEQDWGQGGRDITCILLLGVVQVKCLRGSEKQN